MPHALGPLTVVTSLSRNSRSSTEPLQLQVFQIDKSTSRFCLKLMLRRSAVRGSGRERNARVRGSCLDQELLRGTLYKLACNNRPRSALALQRQDSRVDALHAVRGQIHMLCTRAGGQDQVRNSAASESIVRSINNAENYTTKNAHLKGRRHLHSLQIPQVGVCQVELEGESLRRRTGRHHWTMDQRIKASSRTALGSVQQK